MVNAERALHPHTPTITNKMQKQKNPVKGAFQTFVRLFNLVPLLIGAPEVSNIDHGNPLAGFDLLLRNTYFLR